MAGNKKDWVLKANPHYVDATTFGSSTKMYLSDPLGSYIGSYIGTYSAGGNFTIQPDDAVGSGMHYTSGLQVYELAGDFQGIWVQADINVITDSPIEKVVRAALGLGDDDELQAISYRTKDGEMKIRQWDEE